MNSWSRALLTLFDSTSDNLLRRQTNATDNLVPTACYQSCYLAAVQGQAEGETPALCVANGVFEAELADCIYCITNDTTKSKAFYNLGGKSTLSQYATYCNNSNDAHILSGYVAQISSLQAAASAASAQCASLSSEGAPTPSDCVAVTASAPVSSSISVRATSTTVPASQTSSAIHGSRKGIVVGAAVGGSIGGVLLLTALAVIVIVIRRRKQRAALADAAAKEQALEKPMLHSEDYKPPREELLGTLGTKQYDHTKMSELPSNEAVEPGKEMPANEEIGAMLDNKVRIPKINTSGQSQSTTVGPGANAIPNSLL